MPSILYPLVFLIVSVSASRFYRDSDESFNWDDEFHGGFQDWQQGFEQQMSQFQSNMDKMMMNTQHQIQQSVQQGIQQGQVIYQSGQDGGSQVVVMGGSGWWNGPNVCVDRKEDVQDPGEFNQGGGMINMQSTSCQANDFEQTCVTRVRNNEGAKTITVSHRCCPGFHRALNQPGCVGPSLPGSVEDLLPAMRSLGAEKFASWIVNIGLEEHCSNRNLTVFAPLDEAMDDWEEDQESNDIGGAIIRRSPTFEHPRNVILGHMLPGFTHITDFIDEQVLLSENGESSLRTNVFRHLPQKITTVNCAPLLTANNPARNGVIHTVDRVLPLATKSIAEIVSSDPQLGMLKSMLSQSGLVRNLRESGHYTLFAPTDEAFGLLDPMTRNSFLRGESCTNSVIKHHMIEHTLCSCAILSEATAASMLETRLIFRRNEDGKYFVNDAQMVVRDVVATNGVVHVIDKVLIPDEARSMTTALKQRNLTEMTRVLEMTDLLGSVDTMTNVTVFVPSNDAFNDLTSEQWSKLRQSPESLRDLVMYHIAAPKTAACEFRDDALLQTGVMDKALRINVDAAFPLTPLYTMTVQCARIVDADTRACESHVHIIDKVLFPPSGPVPDILSQSNYSFNILQRLLTSSGVYKDISENRNPYTLLAPTDDAFYALPEDTLQRALNDPNSAKDLISRHVILGQICCASINQNFVPWMSNGNRRYSINGKVLRFSKDSRNRIFVNGGLVKQCDVMATDGVVHVVSKVVEDESTTRRWQRPIQTYPNIFSGFRRRNRPTPSFRRPKPTPPAVEPAAEVFDTIEMIHPQKTEPTEQRTRKVRTRAPNTDVILAGLPPIVQ